MAAFLLGFLLASLIGVTFIYNCYNKREMTEKKLRQNLGNLEHNLAMIQKESELKIDQLESEGRRLRDENKKLSSKVEILQKDFMSVKDQLDECKQRLAE